MDIKEFTSFDIDSITKLCNLFDAVAPFGDEIYKYD
jgi:hypothetical protein